MSLQENKIKLITLGKKMDSLWLEEQLLWCVKKVEKNMYRFKDNFPSACTTDGIYRIKANDDWTNGFWTGLLCLAYEVSGNKEFLEQAQQNVCSFQERLDQHFVLDHHDIGFLYSLSAGAVYRLTGDENDKNLLIQAADVLSQRFQPKGQFIQAWGKYGDPKEYRLIIDSLINLPLLFCASKLSGDRKYEKIARKHFSTVMNTVIREDATTFHTYYFDLLTGEKSYGATHQGNTDDSIWARGQSWAVLGIPLDESYMKDEPFPSIYSDIVDVFIENLPGDLVPYWDFDFTDKNPSAKDSSALAIAACGLLEANKISAYDQALELAKGMVYQLGEHYTTRNHPDYEGLLDQGVYAFAEGKGIEEANLWGDYFYFESLMRLAKPMWNCYW